MDVLLTETEDENVSCPTRKINESVVLRKCHPKKLVRVYSSECRNIISCRKFWHGAKTLAQNFGKEKLAKTFGMEFHAEIPCRNSEPKY